MTHRREQLVAVALATALGFLVALAGAFVIRVGADLAAPVTPGLGLALLTFASGALFTRGLSGPWGFGPYVVGAVGGLGMTAFYAPGADRILPPDLTTYLWIGGIGVVAVVVALLPGRWFQPPLPLPDDAPSHPLPPEPRVGPGGAELWASAGEPEPRVGPGGAELWASAGEPEPREM